MENPFVRAYPPAAPPAGPALWLLANETALLVRDDGTDVSLIEEEKDPQPESAPPLYLGTLNGRPCFANDLAPLLAGLPGAQLVPLRSLYGKITDTEYQLAGYALQMLNWRKQSAFCPVCGHVTEAKEGDWGRHCPHCSHTSYPQISPAVLILIYDDSGRILLGHKPGWGARYSILAGFVEPGESLEECVHREALEEIGASVSQIAYTGSQPWPYPHQLMIGFRARYVGGTIKADGVELDDAKWFDVNALPELPPPLSLSRQMIDSWRESLKAVPV